MLPDDVLMNIVGPPLGKIGIVPSTYAEWNVNQAIAIFRARDQLVPLHLLHALRFPDILEGILKQARGVRQQNINLEQCRNIAIPVPPMELQKELGKQVTEIRELEAAQTASRQRLDNLFQSMLHRAFNGGL